MEKVKALSKILLIILLTIFILISAGINNISLAENNGYKTTEEEEIGKILMEALDSYTTEQLLENNAYTYVDNEVTKNEGTIKYIYSREYEDDTGSYLYTIAPTKEFQSACIDIFMEYLGLDKLDDKEITKVENAALVVRSQYLNKIRVSVQTEEKREVLGRAFKGSTDSGEGTPQTGPGDGVQKEIGPIYHNNHAESYEYDEEHDDVDTKLGYVNMEEYIKQHTPGGYITGPIVGEDGEELGKNMEDFDWEEVTSKSRIEYIKRVNLGEETYNGNGNKVKRIVPQNFNGESSTGLMPQYWGNDPEAEWNVTLSKNRWSLTTKTWNATMKGKVAYCSEYKKPVVYGYWHGEPIFLRPGQTVTLPNTGSASVGGKTVREQWEQIKTEIKKHFEQEEFIAFSYDDPGVECVDGSSSPTTEQRPIYSFEISNPIPGNYLDCLGYLIVPDLGFEVSGSPYYLDSDGAEAKAEEDAGRVMKSLYETMTANRGKGGGTNKEGLYIPPSPYGSSGPSFDDPTKGPYVTVLETSARENDGYKFVAEGKYKNDPFAFIFSTSENAYSAPFSKKYSLNNIQGAYWRAINEYTDYIEPLTSGGVDEPDAIELSTKANNYIEFLQKVGALKEGKVHYKDIKDDNGKTTKGYELYVDGNKTEVEKITEENYKKTIKIIEQDARPIADRENQRYTVGPFRVEYPYYEDINYIKALKIEYAEGELVYGEKYAENGQMKNNDDFEVIMENNGIQGSNGMLKKYPNSGEKFFIVFDAAKINFNTRIKLHVLFEHIDETYAKFAAYDTNIDTFQYNGYCLIEGSATANSSGSSGSSSGVMNYPEKSIAGNYTMLKIDVPIRVYYELKGDSRWDHTHSYTEDEDSTTTEEHYEYFNNENVTLFQTNLSLYIPYIQLSYNPIDGLTYDAQTLNAIGARDPEKPEDYSPEDYAPEEIDETAERTIELQYNGDGQVVEKVTTTKKISEKANAYRTYATVDVIYEQPPIPDDPPPEIIHEYGDVYFDLSIDIGGHVWVDENGGKEDIANNKFDENEEGVPDVKVTIECSDPDWFKRRQYENVRYTNKKEEDINQNGKIDGPCEQVGGYLFTELNPMYKYRIIFEYNGQYYQPVNYEPETTWGQTDWRINSNAKDDQGEREKLNERFASIGAYHGYYKDGDNQSYYRKELEDAGIINKYGLLDPDNKSSNDSSMKKFVEDCLIEAATSLEYPYPKVIFKNKKLENAIKNGETYHETYKKTTTIVTRTDPYTGEYIREYYYSGTMDLEKKLAERQKSLSEELNVVNALYDDIYYVNLGLDEREQSDLAVKKDIDHVTMEINGQSQTYYYDSLETKIENDQSWKIGVRLEDLGSNDLEKWKEVNGDTEPTIFDENAFKRNYDTSYTREIYPSDYLYKVSNYGADNKYLEYGKSKADELEVYITYKIIVRNNALSIRARVDELVDYYDEDLEYVDERSYIQIKKPSRDNAAQEGKYSVKASAKTELENAKDENRNIDGYNKLYITGLGRLSTDENSNYLAAGQNAYVYLTFRVKKDKPKDKPLEDKDRNILDENEKWIRLDEYINGDSKGVGKENIVEVNGYTTQYPLGAEVPNIGSVQFKPAGIIDRNSNSGNVTDQIKDKDIESNSTDLEKLEDDSAKAPNMKLVLYRDNDGSKNRVIAGTVFEDVRTEANIDQKTKIGNGQKDSEEKTINGVTVQLVELMENGKEFVWREFGASQLPGIIQKIDQDMTTEGGSGDPDNGNEGADNKETPIINLKYGDTWLVKDYDFGANTNGAYAFKSFAPGKYVVRFIYGDTVKTVVPSEINNNTSYNGQDYKSTTYQVGMTQNKDYSWEQTPVRLVVEDNGLRLFTEDDYKNKTNWIYAYRVWNGNAWYYKLVWNLGEKIKAPTLTEVSTFKEDASNNETVALPEDKDVNSWETPIISKEKQNGYLYNITEADKEDAGKKIYENVSDAKDIESRRNQVIDYSDNDVTNYIAEVLASHKGDFRDEGYKTANNNKNELLKNLIDNTQMTAETGLMVIEIECDRTESEYEGEIEDDKDKKQGKYVIDHVNLGLEERPKAQLAINKEITNIKLTLADGSILFDAKAKSPDPVTNLLWKKDKNYLDGNDNYDNYIMNSDKFDGITKIRDQRSKDTFGLAQLTMDEELMHGASIQMSYEIKVQNIGEVDYYNSYKTDENNNSIPVISQDRMFYYKGQKSDTARVATTRADQVLDYVENNLQFNAKLNANWNTIAQGDLVKQNNTETLVNRNFEGETAKYNTKIVTENLNADLLPEIFNDNGSHTEVPLLLSQVITSQNDTLKDLTYRNIVEIVKTSNTLGRRMEYSIVGNQNPFEDPAELDSDKSEQVRILPPFGNAGKPIIIAAIVLLATILIVGGTFFIKKKVLIK